MSKRMLAGVVPLAATLAFAGTALGHSTKAPTLKGTVGPGFTITLKQAGKTVKTLKAGTYSFAIADKASFHGFTLEQEKGGSFEKALTAVSFVGSKTVMVTLKKGRYKYYCPPHESSMFGFFNVT